VGAYLKLVFERNIFDAKKISTDLEKDILVKGCILLPIRKCITDDETVDTYLSILILSTNE